MNIKEISWQQTIPLRQSVLWPDKPAEFCHLEGDNEALHFGAFVNGELICVASVFVEAERAQLRKFATRADSQGKGIGSQMLKAILNTLNDTNICFFWCDARESALAFYQRFGMKAVSNRFYKSGVPYKKMQLHLK